MTSVALWGAQRSFFNSRPGTEYRTRGFCVQSSAKDDRAKLQSFADKALDRENVLLLVVNLISEAPTFEEARVRQMAIHLWENDQVEEVLYNMEQGIGVAGQGAYICCCSLVGCSSS